MAKEIKQLKDKALQEIVIHSLLNSIPAPKYDSELTSELIEEMLNTSIIKKCVNTLIRGVLSRDLIVVNETDDKNDKIVLEIQQRVNKIKNKTKLVEAILMSCFTKMAVHEIIYNEDFTIKELIEIPISLVKYDKDKQTYLLNTSDKVIDLTENPRKWLISVHNESIKDRQGTSLLQGVLKDYLEIKELKDKLRFVAQKYGETVLIFAYGKNQDPKEVQETVDGLKRAGKGTVIAMPLIDGNLRDNLFTMRLADIDTIIYERLIKMYEENIVTTMLGSNLTIGNDGSSSYALGNIHQEEKEKIEDSLALYVRDELDKLIDIDGAFFNYNPLLYYISLERQEKEQDRLAVEKEKIALQSSKVQTLETLTRAGYELTEEEVTEYLGFKKVLKKEYSPSRGVNEFASRVKKEDKIIKDFYDWQDQEIKIILQELEKSTYEQLKNAKDYESLQSIKLENERLYDLILASMLFGKYQTTFNNKKKLEFEDITRPNETKIAFLKSQIAIDKKELANIEDSARRQYFWLSKSGSLETTKKIQNVIIDGFAKGKTSRSILKELEKEDLLLGLSKNSNYWKGAIEMNLAIAQSQANWINMKKREHKGFAYARYNAIVDGRETKICHELNGKVMSLKEWEAQGLVPPLHYRCRSQLVQLIDKDVIDENGNYKKEINVFSKKDLEHLKKHRQKGFGKVDNTNKKLQELLEQKEKQVNSTKDRIMNKVEQENKIGYNDTKIEYKEMTETLKRKYEEDTFKLFGYEAGDGILTKEEVECFKYYTGDEYKKINEFIRGEYDGHLSVWSDYHEKYYDLTYVSETIRKVISKNKLKDNLKVYRGISEKEFNILKNGKEFKNFVSTSFDKEIANYFAEEAQKITENKEKYLVIIEAPKGTESIYINGKGAYEDENELIINVGTKYKVKKVERNILSLEVLKND